MNALGKLVGIFAVCGAFLSSCGGDSPQADSCGSHPQVASITGFNASYVGFEKPIEAGVYQSPRSLATNESPTWNTFGVEFKVSVQYTYGRVEPRLQFSIFPQALACSPNLSGKQKVTKISITSADAFSDKYPAGSELVSLFGSMDHPASSLTGLLVGYQAPLALKLILLEAPQYARQNFEVKIGLDDGNTYTLMPGDVYFALP